MVDFEQPTNQSGDEKQHTQEAPQAEAKQTEIPNPEVTHTEQSPVSTDGNKQIAMIVYVLQALGFVTGVTAVAGIIVNYIKLGDVQGTWVESHFRWQIRTFWFGLLWGFVGLITFIFLVGYIILIANMVWIIYRIVKGWLMLSENKPVK